MIMTKRKGRMLMQLVLCIILIGVLCYAALIAMVCWKETHVPAVDHYDAIVVLGAQVREDGTPSIQLQWRLEAAIKAWQQSPCLIVTCGAQGDDEPLPEGVAMRDFLVANGIPEDQVLMDTSSFNTRQNLHNAAQLLADYEDATVCIVTSDFHLPRSMALAADEGLKATGIGSPTKLEFWAKNHFREALAWVKYWLEKYLSIRL